MGRSGWERKEEGGGGEQPEGQRRRDTVVFPPPSKGGRDVTASSRVTLLPPNRNPHLGEMNQAGAGRGGDDSKTSGMRR